MRLARHELDGELLAVHILQGPATEGFHLVNANEDALQVGRNRRPRGYVAPPHAHGPPDPLPPRARQEVLHVLAGAVRVDLYALDGRPGPRVTVRPGETIVLFAGHGVEFLEDTELLEVKQGPYPGPARDKRFLA